MRSFRLLTTLIIAGLLLSSAPPVATPRALAMAGPARPVAVGAAAPSAAPAPRVLSSVPVDSPAVPHPTPPPPSLPAKAKIGAIGNASSQATLLLLPRNASGASDKLWRYRNGAWTGITLPQSGWAWNSIAADPFNADRWLLLGNGTTVSDLFPVTGNSVKASGTTVSPLWLTLNAGVTWQPIQLTMSTHSPAYNAARIRQVEFDTTNEGVIAFSGTLYWPATPEGSADAAVWRGRFNAPSLAGFVSGMTWQDTFYSVPGIKGDLVVSEGDSPGLGTAGRLGYVPNGASSITQSGSGYYGYELQIDRLPGASRAVVGLVGGIVMATSDYRTLMPTVVFTDTNGCTVCSLAVTANAVYLGGRSGGSSGTGGVLKITNILGTPTSAIVAADGLGMSFARADRRSHTAVAALFRGDSGNQPAVYLTTDEVHWAAIAWPPGVAPSDLADRLEVIAPKKALANSQNRTTGTCQCNAHKQSSRPVNTRSGAYWTRVTDLAVPTPGPALDWTRTYLSQALTDTTGLLGSGWQHPYATHIITPTPEAGRVLIFSHDGNEWRYELQDDGSYTPFPGVYSQLVRGSAVYTLTLRDQQQWIFDAASGRLIAQRDAQGRALNFSYNGSQQLTVVADALKSSRALTITYNLDGRISQVSDGLRAVHYGYDAQGDLATVDDVMNRRTTYGYLNPPAAPPTHLLTSITNALGQSIETMGYTTTLALPQVITQTLQDGRALTFQYLSASTIITTTAPGSLPEVQQIDYAADNTVAGVRVNGQATWASGFDDSFSPSETGDGNGNTTYTAYSKDGLPIAQTNALGQTSQADYDPTTNNPIATVDPLGITSRFRYDAVNNLISTTVGITTTSPVSATTLFSYQYQHAIGVWNSTAAGATDSRSFEQTSPDGVVTRAEYGDARFPRLPTRVTVGYENGVFDVHRPDQDLITAYRYDTFGRVISTTVGLGAPAAYTDLTGYNLDNTVITTTQNYKAPGLFNAALPDQNILTKYGYDKLGRTVALTDTLGQVDLTHYDAKGRVDWTVRNAVPAQFDAGGLPVYHAYSRLVPDRNVNAIYGYDGLGRSTFVTETGILTGTFNASTLQFSDVTTRTTRMEYDTLSRPVTVTLNYRAGMSSTADRNVKLYTRYDGASNVITQTDALGRWTVMEYDALNRPVKTIANYQDGNPLSGPPDADLVTFTQYDSAGRVARTVDNYVDGAFTATQPITDRITLLQYDQFSRSITTTLNYDPPTLGTRTDTNRVSLNRYDPATLRLQGQRDPLGRWVSQQYDLLGRVVTTTQNCTGGTAPASCGSPTSDTNVPTRVLYDGLGRTVLITDALSIVTQSTYDGLGRTTKIVQNYIKNGPTTAVTNVTTLTRYDALGRTTIMTDALGYPTRQTYNGLSQTILVTDTMGRATRMGYDGQGMLRWSKPPSGQVTVYQVDGLGRVVTTIANYQDGVADTSSDQDLISRTVYDTAGRRTRTIDAMNRVTALAYDNLDQLITVTENYVASGCTWVPCSVQTQYQYDRAGHRSAIIDANNHLRRFSYDAADQQQQAIDALNHTTIYTYNQVGQLTQQQDPRGANYKLTMTYDGLDRLTGTTATTLGSITAQYDALGRRTSLTDGSGATSFFYDRLSRMTRAQITLTGQPVQTVQYGYDARGSRTQLIYPDATTLNYAYQADGQPQTVSQVGVATPLATYAYDPIGRLAQATRLNGSVTNYGYDKADRLREQRSSQAGATVAGFQYQTNRLGQRTVVTDTLPLAPAISATRIKTISFEGANLTDPTTGADALSTAKPTLESSAPLKSAYAARIPNTGSTYLQESFSGVNDLYVSFYLKLTALPAATTQIALISNGATPVGNLRITSGGILQLYNNATLLGSGATALTAGTLYRIGLHQKKGTGSNAVLEVYLASGDALFGSPSFANTTQTFITQATQLQIGATTATAANMVVDDIMLDSGAMPPPSSGPTVVQGPAIFRAATNYPVGDSPQSIVTGDLNGDAKLDLVTVNNLGNTICVLLGTGAGSFGAATSIAVGTHPDAIAIGDLNGDTKLDVAVTILGSNTVGVLLGTGTGGFGAVANFAVGSLPVSIAMGDLNGDSAPDLVTANGNSNNVSMLIGTGTGSFGIATNFAAGTSPNSVAIGNLNGDSMLDLVVTSGSSSVKVWLGAGMGAFGSPTTYTVGLSPNSVAISDLNADGKQDLTVTDSSTQSVYVLLGTGTGTFGAATGYATGFTSSSAVVGDLNVDGKLDLGVASSASGNVSVLLGSGTGSFGTATAYAAGRTPFAIAIGDLSGDGKLDLATANADSDNVSVLLGTGTGSFAAASSYGVVGSNPSSIATGDLNADGKWDLVVANSGSNNVSVLLGAGTGSFGAATNFTAGTTPQSVALGDLNADNKLDLVVANSGSANVSVRLGTGTGSFGAATNFTVGTTPQSVALGDLNADNKLDLVVANSGSNNMSVLLGSGTGSFGAATNFTVGTAPQSVALRDLNADGKLDLLAANNGSANVSVRLGTGTGSFGATTNFTVGTGPKFVALGDLNADGKLDLLVANNGSNSVSRLLGTGSGSFGAAANSAAGTAPTAVALGDMNGDGKLDVVASNGGSDNVSVWLGDGAGSLGTATSYTIGGDPQSVTLADLNSDGQLDLSVANRSGGTVSVLLNQIGARNIKYTYDGLLRLASATESPGSTFAYGYDLAGNRTSVQVNGGTPATASYDAANQRVGWTYDNAGNLTNDGTATSTYDALNRLLTVTAGSQTRTNTYNGDGVLAMQVANGTTTRYIQDLAAPLSQVLQAQNAATTKYLYGLERLASVSGATRTWYLGDALGSVRRTLSDTGVPLGVVNYDPWGTPEGAVTPPTFGFTGEQQDVAVGLVNLRARWYSTGKGTFTSRDPFAGMVEQPYSLHPYQYGYSDPMLYTDPSGLQPPPPIWPDLHKCDIHDPFTVLREECKLSFPPFDDGSDDDAGSDYGVEPVGGATGGIGDILYHVLFHYCYQKLHHIEILTPDLDNFFRRKVVVIIGVEYNFQEISLVAIKHPDADIKVADTNTMASDNLRRWLNLPSDFGIPGSGMFYPKPYGLERQFSNDAEHVYGDATDSDSLSNSADYVYVFHPTTDLHWTYAKHASRILKVGGEAFFGTGERGVFNDLLKDLPKTGLTVMATVTNLGGDEVARFMGLRHYPTSYHSVDVTNRGGKLYGIDAMKLASPVLPTNTPASAQG